MQALSFKNISAVYIVVGLFIVYSIWVPSTFLTASVWKSLLASGAVTAMATIGLVLPLAAGVFDLAVGSEIGFGAIVFAWLLGDEHVPLLAAFGITMAVGALVGTCSGLLITRAKIDSFIATLGMSSILLALIAWISGGQQILDLGSSAQSVAIDQLLGVADPVWFMLVTATLVWFLLQRTTLGRRVYATGGNASAARLAGVRTDAVVVGVLVACGAIAAISGSLISAQLATGDPTVGPAYLLPAYAAAFLGSTQFRGARYNVWGAVVAVYVLAIGVKGLQLAGAPTWIPDLFNGAALLLAVGMAKVQRAASRYEAIRSALRRYREPPEEAVTSIESPQSGFRSSVTASGTSSTVAGTSESLAH